MLTKLDEYPLHQIANTFAAVQTSDKHWNDGHYVCLCDREGRVCLVSTVRNYQNNDVLDGFVCIRHRGKQHNIRVSRRLRPDLDHFGAGPLRIEIRQPMQEVRLVLEPNEYGMSCDVVCRTTAVPYEDPIVVSRLDGRLVTERAVYEVAGVCEGWVQVGDERVELNPKTDAFFRNHSWGTMPGRGGPREHAAPPTHTASRNGFRNWVLYTMPDHAGMFTFQENVQGRRSGLGGAVLLPERQVPIVDVKHALTFYPGSTRLKGGSITVEDAEGTERTYEVEELGWVYCQGGGYFGGFNDGLGQGVYRGDYYAEGEVWDVADPEKVVYPDGSVKRFSGAWAENFTRLRSGAQEGLAHYECVTFGAYEPYDLQEMPLEAAAGAH